VAYGPQSLEVVQRCYRGLKRAAAQLEDGDVTRASLEAVMIRFPDLAPQAVAKLAGLTNLQKGGTAWEDQPRVPAGQTDGGQWTADGGGSAADADDTAAVGARTQSTQADRPTSPFDPGVYHPSQDKPRVVLTAGSEDAEEGFRQGIGGNEPPYDPMTLQDIFPGLKNEPGLAVPLAPVDSFLGFSAVADEANLAATEGLYFGLVKQIRAIDPTWHDDELFPPGGIAGLSVQGRNNLINSLRIQRAVAIYQTRGDIRPLQVETFRFLQGAVDEAYEEAVQKYNRGDLKVSLSREEAIGNSLDKSVRGALQNLYNTYGISYGRGQNITINGRDASRADQTYRRPDVRLEKVSFDWSLTFKTFSTAQIRGFFRADSEPDFVIIIRPSQLGGRSAYLIPRPPGDIRKGETWCESFDHIFRNR
jgi:hypothetical protein